MSQAEIVRKLVEGVVSKLTEEINSWRENLKLRVEAELYEAAKAVVEKYSSVIDELEREARLEREFRLYSAMIELERDRLSFVESFLDKVISAVQERVKQIKGTDKYREYLRACLETARFYMGSDEFVVKCSSSDKELVQQLSAELKLSLIIEPVPDELYGIKALSRDGKVSVDLTLPARLSLLREKVRGILTKYARG